MLVAPPDAMNLLLKVLLTCEGVTTTHVFSDFPVRIGRGGECELRIRHRRVSRHHARIALDGDKLVLLDEDSRNGVVCNGVKLEPGKPVPLKDGDQLAIGSISATVRLSELTEVMPGAVVPRADLEPNKAFPKAGRIHTDADDRREPTILLASRSGFRCPTLTAPPGAYFGSGAAPVRDPDAPRMSFSLDEVERMAKPYMPQARPPTEFGIDALLEGLPSIPPVPAAGTGSATATPEEPVRPWLSRALGTLLERVRAVVEHARRLLGLRKALPARPLPADSPVERQGTGAERAVT